jgi:hypothetical protein
VFDRRRCGVDHGDADGKGRYHDSMRALAIGLLVAGSALAQGPAPISPVTEEEPARPPPPSTPPTYTPPPPTYTPPPPTYTPTPPYDPTQSSIHPLDATPTYTPTSPSVSLSPPRMVVSPQMRERWNHSRALYAAGGGIGLIGTGFTLSSLLIVTITGYPCNPDDPIHKINPNDTCNKSGMKYDPPKPTDAVPLLAYLGSSVSAFGFILSSAGLGQQHRLLRELSADVPRGTFYGGTALGVLGFTAVGAGYFFGFTDYLNPHDQGIAILACTVTSAALSALSSLLFAVDASRTKKAWQSLGTF